ncbi:MAG: MarR family transcriptional regulator [Halosimplex sp.]
MPLTAADLNSTDHEVLDELRQGRVTPQFLANQLNITRQYSSERLKRLQEHQLVARIGSGLYELKDDPRWNAQLRFLDLQEEFERQSGFLPLEVAVITESEEGIRFTIEDIASSQLKHNYFTDADRELLEQTGAPGDLLLQDRHGAVSDEYEVEYELEWRDVSSDRWAVKHISELTVVK